MVRCFLCGYYSGCFAGFLVWLLFADGVHSSESHCDTARPTIQVSLIVIQLGLLFK